MALTITNPTFSGPEFRTSKKASYIGSTSGFLTLGATVEDDYFLSTPFQTLTMIHPRPSAELPTGSVWNKWVTNAPYKAYPSARGGCFPYIWSLVGAPSGMTISSTLTNNSTYANRAAHGRITWTTPVAGTFSFTIVCVDQLGARVSQTVSLYVNDDNAIWLDSTGVDSPTRAGTKADPFAKIDNFYATTGGVLDAADSRFHGKLLICRAGTYTIPRTSGQTIMQYGDNKPVSIHAYDADAPVWDCSNSSLQSNAAAGALQLEMIGMTFSGEDEASQLNTEQVSFTSDYLIICDHTIKDFQNGGSFDDDGAGPHVPGGDNPGGIRNFDSGYSYYNQLRNIRITGLGGGTNMTANACGIVMFGLREYEVNNVECLALNGAVFCILHMKHDHQFGVTRNCWLNYDFDTAQQFTGCWAINDESDLGGNEFEYNFMKMLNTADPCWCLGSNNIAVTVASLAMRRNTVLTGTARLTNCVVGGNFIRGANVIQNAASGFTEHAVWTGKITDQSTSRLNTTGLIDSNGLLTGAERTSYLNKKGWEINV